MTHSEEPRGWLAARGTITGSFFSHLELRWSLWPLPGLFKIHPGPLPGCFFEHPGFSIMDVEGRTCLNKVPDGTFFSQNQV